ncbi:MAG TPA: UDP-glucose/GDP-mannose dehydrogenase family protein [Pyrinomonadaceae bacterium]|nr:UDP-glucose/GDP-mannose dehydrogenase family protein [Pyrinomonadaceae bacterium]
MHITIIGTGYVGLTTGVCLAGIGHQVICVDVMPERVAAINEARSPFYEPGLDEMLSSALANGRLRATTELASAVAASEVTFITVGTPQIDGDIDLSYVSAAARQIGSALRDVSGYHVVAVKSTVIPGTTDTLVRNMIEETSGRATGEFGLCMNPEFLREGSAIDDFNNPDRIVIGQWDEKSGRVLAQLYESFDCPMVFTTLRNAEMVKYASNSLLATLISFSNEIAALCEVTPDTDVDVVLGGVHLDRRLSGVNGERISPGVLSFLRAGCGFGGSCLPKDVNALRAYARQQSVTPSLLDAVMAINAERPARLVRLAEDALGSLEGATVALLGLAFKAGTDDVRESPALAVMNHLLSKGAVVRSYDPIFTSAPAGLRVDENVHFCHTLREALAGADAALVITGWPEFAEADWKTLPGEMRRQLIIDGRNFLRDVSWPQGVTYLTIGRMPESAIVKSVEELAAQ